MRGRPLAPVVLAMALALGASSAPVTQAAPAAPAGDARTERERVHAEAAAVAASLNTDKASLSEVDAAVQTLAENLATQEAALARTEDELAQATKEVKAAEAAIKQNTAEAELLRVVVRDRAVRTFVNPPQDSLLTYLTTQDIVSASSRRFFIDLQSASDGDLADALRGRLAEIDHQRDVAAEARDRAQATKEELTERNAAVRAAKADQEQLASRLQAQIDNNIERSVKLAATDRALSKQIADEQAALVARLAAVQAEKDRQLQTSTAKPSGGTSRPSGGSPKPSAPTPTTTPPNTYKPDGGETAPLPPSMPGGVITSDGIRVCRAIRIEVSCSIAGSLTNLLNAAQRRGLTLTGGGYRSTTFQIELRRAHCGDSYYAIYQMPAAECIPQTAPPGRSQHEIGLAVDFNNCNTRSTACYQWLAANAARFGFYNLPAEPWHWSTTGS